MAVERKTWEDMLLDHCIKLGEKVEASTFSSLAFSFLRIAGMEPWKGDLRNSIVSPRWLLGLFPSFPSLKYLSRSDASAQRWVGPNQEELVGLQIRATGSWRLQIMRRSPSFQIWRARCGDGLSSFSAMTWSHQLWNAWPPSRTFLHWTMASKVGNSRWKWVWVRSRTADCV